MSKANLSEVTAVFFIRALSGLVRVLPLSVALGLGRLVVPLVSKMLPRRRVAYVNLKAAFGNRYSAGGRKKILHRLITHLAQNAVEVLRFPQMSRDYLERYIPIEHVERYEEAADRKQGAILITPHIGNWELIQVVSAMLGRPLHILARRQKHSHLDDYLNELRSSCGAVTIHKGGGVRDLIRILKSGGTIGALGDLSGGRDGTVIRFFGRKTTAPSGIFSIAKRTNSTVLPCFIVRERGPCHRVFVEEAFPLGASGDEERDVKESLQNYYHMLERWIERYPDQWLWVYKRWKYCFTKRIVVLSDGRPGHTNQSEAIAKEFERLRGELASDYEFEFRTLQVKFKSPWHRRLLFALGIFFLPFVQSRLAVLRFFLSDDCAKALCDVHADIIISAGASLAPINLALKRENLARSIAVMKPPFPYGPRHFDLSIIPAHDVLPKRAGRVVRTMVAPSRVDEALLQRSGEKLKELAPLSTNGARRIGVFIGGKTKSYRIMPKKFQKWLSLLKACARETGYELLVTTSRRTDSEISTLVKEAFAQDPLCKLLIIANESNVEGAAYGMLALSHVAVVTEDSISMISDAVRARKQVLVMQLGNGKLSRKHRHFQKALTSHAWVQVANATDFERKFAATRDERVENIREHESKQIQEALRAML